MVMIFSSISFFSPVLFYSSMHLVYAFMHFGTQCNVVVSTNMIRKKKMKNETPLSIWRNSCTHGTQYIHQMPSLHYYVSFHIQTQSFQQSRWSIFFLYLRFNRQIEKQSNERNYGTAWCFVTHTENEEDWYFCFFLLLMPYAIWMIHLRKQLSSLFMICCFIFITSNCLCFCRKLTRSRRSFWSSSLRWAISHHRCRLICYGWRVNVSVAFH